MKKCNMCNYVYDDGMGFCPECGAIDFTPVQKAEPQKTETAKPEAAVQETNKAAGGSTAGAQATPAANGASKPTDNGGCLGLMILWGFVLVAIFVGIPLGLTLLD